MNRNVDILNEKKNYYSPSVKDLDIQLIFLIFHTFVCKSGCVDKRLDAVRGEKNLQAYVLKV